MNPIKPITYKPLPFTGSLINDPDFAKTLAIREKFKKEYNIGANGTFTKDGTQGATVVSDDRDKYCILVTGTSEEVFKDIPDVYDGITIIKEPIGVIQRQPVQRY